MKSGLEGRNNAANGHAAIDTLRRVSMKSGLEGRNNAALQDVRAAGHEDVSMKSGLEGRNNPHKSWYFKMKDGSQ